jgi:hypothetical protein
MRVGGLNRPHHAHQGNAEHAHCSYETAPICRQLQHAIPMFVVNPSPSLSLAFRRFYPEMVIRGNAARKKLPSQRTQQNNDLWAPVSSGRRGENQQKHYHRRWHSRTIGARSTDTRLWQRHLRLNF